MTTEEELEQLKRKVREAFDLGDKHPDGTITIPDDFVGALRLLTSEPRGPRCMRCKGPQENPHWWGCNACVNRDRQEGLCKRD